MNQEIMSPTPIELFQSNLIYTLIVLSFLSLLTKIKKKKACTIPMESLILECENAHLRINFPIVSFGQFPKCSLVKFDGIALGSEQAE
jgi:hypothetical protein